MNITDVEGQTPLHAASIKGNMQAIIELLRCPSIDIKVSLKQRCHQSLLGHLRVLWNAVYLKIFYVLYAIELIFLSG